MNQNSPLSDNDFRLILRQQSLMLLDLAGIILAVATKNTVQIDSDSQKILERMRSINAALDRAGAI